MCILGCDNKPYKESSATSNTQYGTIGEDPKSMDPSFAYDSLSLSILGSIYDTLLQYSYLKRPYQVEPSLAAKMPEPILAKEGEDLPGPYGFRITLKKGLRFQDDPCFEATRGEGRPVNTNDFIFSLKRLADPAVNSPVRSIFTEKIAGLAEFNKENQKLFKKLKEEGKEPAADYSMEVSGIRKINDLVFEVYLTEAYPQFLYWLAMPFTTPIPREAVAYYDSEKFPGRVDFKDHPVGTGAYFLKEYRKGQRMVLAHNQNFREDFYPSDGEPGDKEAGLLDDAGKRMPFVDEFVISLVKESIPRWYMFRQGYLDGSGIPNESFDRVITAEGTLSENMASKGIRLFKAKRLVTYYYAFNMDDPLVGKNKKLRQAMGCAINTAEYIDLYLNKLATVAQSPLPPGIFGYDSGYRNRFRFYDLDKARGLLEEAGYEDGIDPETGEPLVITFDTSDTSASGRQVTRWLTSQIEEVGIRLKVVVNDWNTHQQKADVGNFQFIRYGWLADYPDPENFLFLLASENKRPGVNYANFFNDEYDALFNKMKGMVSHGEEGTKRKAIIRDMLKILEEECPWVPSHHSETFSLVHDWNMNVKLHGPGHNLRKYKRIDATARAAKRKEWNKPKYEWVALTLCVLFALTLPGFFYVRGRR